MKTISYFLVSLVCALGVVSTARATMYCDIGGSNGEFNVIAREGEAWSSNIKNYEQLGGQMLPRLAPLDHVLQTIDVLVSQGHCVRGQDRACSLWSRPNGGAFEGFMFNNGGGNWVSTPSNSSVESHLKVMQQIRDAGLCTQPTFKCRVEKGNTKEGDFGFRMQQAQPGFDGYYVTAPQTDRNGEVTNSIQFKTPARATEAEAKKDLELLTSYGWCEGPIL